MNLADGIDGIDGQQADELEAAVEKVIGVLRNIEIAIEESITEDKEATFISLMNQVTECFAEIDRLKQTCPGDIPTEVIFQYIDGGKNPELYTQKQLGDALLAQQRRAGQLQAFARLKGEMEQRLQQIQQEASATSH